MFKPLTSSVLVGCMIAVSVFSSSPHAQAQELAKKDPAIVLTRIGDGKPSSDDVGIYGISTRFYNVSCARGYYAEFHVGYGSFTHSFERFPSGADVASAFESQPGGGYWRAEGGGTSYKSTTVNGSDPVFHTAAGCR